MTIEVPREEIIQTIKDRGWTQGEFGDDTDGPVCLHGAVRLCCPVPGDAYIIEQVDEARGYGTAWNDATGRTPQDVLEYARAMPDITDDELRRVFGPQWASIVALVRRAATLTETECEALDDAEGITRFVNLDAALDAALYAASIVDRVAAFDASRGAARDAVWPAARVVARNAAREAAWCASCTSRALVVRHRIGHDGFTQGHYDTLTRPWRTVIGKVHPDDAELRGG